MVEVKENLETLNSKFEDLERNQIRDEEMREMEIKIDELEQKTLESKIIISSTEPFVDAESDTPDRKTGVVRHRLSDKLGIDSTLLSSIPIHQLDTEGKRFLMNVGDPSTRLLMFKKIRQKKPDNLFLNDFLTKKRPSLMYEMRKLRDLKTKLKVKRCSLTMGGCLSL